MKVICINNKPISGITKTPSSLFLIEENKVYTVTGTNEGSDNNGYYLKGINYPGCGFSYHKSRFIPLSTIDEMELLEQRQTQYA